MTMGSSNSANGQLGDTALTKVFVGGLAWETPKEAIRDHFAKYGEILEAVIIFDKATARSKGYGFVTFKEPNAAKKACEDSSPIICGRRANCNLAALGARRSKLPPALPPQLGSSGVAWPSTHLRPPSQVHWYYPGSGALLAAAPFLHGHHQALPYYGYSPTYGVTEINSNHLIQRLGTASQVLRVAAPALWSYNGGPYVNGRGNQMYAGAGEPAANTSMMGANTLMPIYNPLYHHYQYHHQSQAVGLPAHVFPPAIATTPPPVICKPTSVTMAPATAVGTAGSAEGFKKGS